MTSQEVWLFCLEMAHSVVRDVDDQSLLGHFLKVPVNLCGDYRCGYLTPEWRVLCSMWPHCNPLLANVTTFAGQPSASTDAMVRASFHWTQDELQGHLRLLILCPASQYLISSNQSRNLYTVLTTSLKRVGPNSIWYEIYSNEQLPSVWGGQSGRIPVFQRLQSQVFSLVAE